MKWCWDKVWWNKKRVTSDRSVTIGADNTGAIFTGDIQTVVINPSTASTEVLLADAKELSSDELRRIAEDLMAAGKPPSLLHLITDASTEIRSAICELATVPRVLEQTSDHKTTSIAGVARMEELRHLFTAQPGSGKTHALWAAANEILNEGAAYPLFIPIGQMGTWSEVLDAIRQVAGSVDVERIIRDRRVCMMLDGWSEFASGQGAEERSKLARALSGTRVIANARQSTSSDSFFRIWTLQPVHVQIVHRVIKKALPNGAIPDAVLVELLRLPLALTLFVLLGGRDNTPGQLLARFHDQLSRGIPGSFRNLLAGATASVALSDHRRLFSRLTAEIQLRAGGTSVDDLNKWLRQLGTLDERLDSVVPVHDLYWSWLVGVGLVSENHIESALPLLSTRESYQLAIQSGAIPTSQSVDLACETDITLAAILHCGTQGSCGENSKFKTHLSQGLADPRIAVSLRAALACLLSNQSTFFNESLNVIAEITAQGIYSPEIEKVLALARLYENRGIIAEWIRPSTSENILDAIADTGGPSWVPWLEQMAHSKRIPLLAAVGCSLACGGNIPKWTIQHLSEFVKNSGWKLKATSKRGKNTDLARWLAEHYDELVTPGNSIFLNINDVLVACGDEEVFDTLLEKFPSMNKNGQDAIGFAIVQKGDPWIGRFQLQAFEHGAAIQHHKLMEVVSSSIDDATARKWIKSGPTLLGWRVLVSRYQNTVIPEMLATLPITFDGVPTVPILEALACLENPPDSLVDEITKRIRGTMMPKTMEQAIGALVNMGRSGFAYLTALISRSPKAIPIYHLARFLRFVEEWEADHNSHLMTQTESGNVRFSDWIIFQRLAIDKTHSMFHAALAKNNELAVRVILDYLRDDEVIVTSITRSMQPLASYDAAFFDYLSNNQKFAKQIPKLFSRCFDAIPQEKLLQFTEWADSDFHGFLLHLSTSPSALHVGLHKKIISRLVSGKIVWHAFRDAALILKVHTRSQLKSILTATVLGRSNQEMWLIRQIESNFSELFINENGDWI